MTLLILDPALKKEVISRRQAWGADLYDEVWDGVYIITPVVNDNEHQRLVMDLTFVVQESINDPNPYAILPAMNVSDRNRDWLKNYRIPDVVVCLTGGNAINRKSHWQGGPDFLIEIVSQGDKSREKFEFYSKIGVRELLIIDRYPWTLELYRLKRKKLTLVGKSTLANSARLESDVVPLSFRLKKVENAPRIEVEHVEGDQNWVV